MRLSLSKTFKLLPAGLLNMTVGKSGISFSSGIPGARVGVNSKGQGRVSLGIPGIPGLRWTKSKKVV